MIRRARLIFIHFRSETRNNGVTSFHLSIISIWLSKRFEQAQGNFSNKFRQICPARPGLVFLFFFFFVAFFVALSKLMINILVNIWRIENAMMMIRNWFVSERAEGSREWFISFPSSLLFLLTLWRKENDEEEEGEEEKKFVRQMDRANRIYIKDSSRSPSLSRSFFNRSAR